MGAQTTTQPLAFGPTRNPWNLAASPSGSSGGLAAAVAAGLVPLAHGNDGLGSIRLPAAWCGVVGFKPSRGLVPVGARSTSRMNHEFVVTRSVRDAAAVLDGVCGTAGELYMLCVPAVPFITAIHGPLTPLRVGLLWQAPDGGPVAPAVAGAVRRVGRLLEEMGHRVDIAHPGALFEDQPAALAPDRPSDYRRRLRGIARLLGRPVTEEDVEPYLWAMAHRHDEETVDDHVAGTDRLQEWAVRLLGWWADHDLLVTPTVPFGPEPLAELQPPPDEPTRLFAKISRHITFTAPFNVTGQPALALPVPDDAPPGTVPPSVQLIAAPSRDDLLLAVAARCEAAGPALPWPEETRQPHPPGR
jgi:amidase